MCILYNICSQLIIILECECENYIVAVSVQRKNNESVLLPKDFETFF